MQEAEEEENEEENEKEDKLDEAPVVDPEEYYYKQESEKSL